MPELPEVEVCRRGLLPALENSIIEGATVRFPRLRRPLPEGLDAILCGRRIAEIRRRGKYLLFHCQGSSDSGWLILHLGMSGNLRFVSANEAPGRHDHFDLLAGQKILRFSDPRRFGLIDWFESASIEEYPLLASLGIEPLSAAFTADWLFQNSRRRSVPIKSLLMDSHTIVGIGNIYAAESLFRAGISPLCPARNISRKRYQRLVPAIRQTLEDAIAAGGSSIRDYIHNDGSSGYFQIQCAVYGRSGEPCRRCGSAVRQIRQAGRSTFYCAGCQK